MDFQVKKSGLSGSFYLEEKPKIVGYINGKCSFDLLQLKYHIPPVEEKVHLNLNAGYDKVIEKKVTPPNNIDDLLYWVQLHPEQVTRFGFPHLVSLQNLRCKPDFISMRGVIKEILLTISKKRYADEDEWMTCASKFKGIIYLCVYRTEQKQNYISNKSEIQKRMDSWGMKFEQYILRDDPASTSDTLKPLNENKEFCCLLSNKIGEHQLLYAGEIDGIQSNKILTEESILEDKIKFVELKTNKQLFGMKNLNYCFKRKAAQAWCQSWLSCVEEVLFGFRDESGIVKELKRYSVNDLSELTKEIFKPNEAINLCNNFLKHVKKVVTEDNDKFIYKFSWNSENQNYIIKGEKLENTNNQSKYSFIPKWFTRENSNTSEL